MIPAKLGNQISGFDQGIPSKEKLEIGHISFVGKYSLEWKGKSNSIWNGQASIENAKDLLK